MLPSRIHIEYIIPGQSGSHAVLAESVSGYDCGAETPFSVDYFQEGGIGNLRIVAHQKVQIISCALMFSHDFSQTERVLFNGWQSWTDTHEVSAGASLPGLTRTPQPVISRWKIDASGDYRFTHYENRPGVRHGWTYAYFTARADVDDQTCLLVASLDESQGFTKISMDKDAALICVEPETPLNSLENGNEWLYKLIWVEELAVDNAFEYWFSLNGVEARVAPLLTGYSSWYRHYNAISAEILNTDLKAYLDLAGRLNTDGFQRLFQVDDGYCLVGDWLQINQDSFPNGLAPLVQNIKKSGFLPGLWMAPFVCEEKSQLFTQHPDWLLRDNEGNLVTTGCHWSGAYALDTLNPEVRAYVRECVSYMVDQGFGLLKLDFLYAACMIPHGGMNRGQLMFDAVQLLREAAGDVYIVGCGVPLAAAFGNFEYCRIGCDVSSEWNGPLTQRFIDRERVSSKNSLGNTVYRAPLCGRAFINDPDAVYLSSARMRESKRSSLLTGAACFGGMLLTSDDVSTWKESHFTQFQEALDLMRQAQQMRMER